jgi:hypothetical protein
MRKTLTLIVLIELLAFSSFSQSNFYNTESQDSSNVYQKSIAEFCKYVDKAFPTVKTIYIEKSALVTWLPTVHGKFSFIFISESEIKGLYKKNKGNFSYTRIVPLRVKDNVFFINIIPFKVEFEKKQLKLINSGALKTKFKYNDNNFTYIETDGGFQYLK